MGDLDLPFGLPSIPDPIDAAQDLFSKYLRDTDIGRRLDVPLNRWLELNRAIRDGIIEGIEMTGLRINAALIRRVVDATAAHYGDYVLGLIEGLEVALRDLASMIWDLGAFALRGLTEEVSFERIEDLLNQAAEFLLDPVKVKHVATMIGLESAREVAHLAKEKDPEQIAQRLGQIVGQAALEAIITALTGGLVKVLKHSPRFARLVDRYKKLRNSVALGIRRQRGRKGAQAAARRRPRRRDALDRELDRGLDETADFGPGSDPAIKDNRARRGRGKKPRSPLDAILDRLTPDRIKILRRLLGKFPDELRILWRQAGTTRALELAQKRNAKVLKLWKQGKHKEARKLARRNYDNYRKRFWTKVRADKKLRKMFEDAGMSFDGKSGTAPYWELPGGGIERLTLEHKDRVVDTPWKSIDPDNFLLVPARENSNMLEFLRGKDPFQIFGPNNPVP